MAYFEVPNTMCCMACNAVYKEGQSHRCTSKLDLDIHRLSSKFGFTFRRADDVELPAERSPSSNTIELTNLSPKDGV